MATQSLALRRFDIKATDEKRVIVIIGKRNSGKCFQRGTRIMLENGSLMNVENVSVGDRLMGDDSTPRTVVSLARGRDEMFCIKPTGKTARHMQHVVTGDHVLCLKYGGSGYVYTPKNKPGTWVVFGIKPNGRRSSRNFHSLKDAQDYSESLNEHLELTVNEFRALPTYAGQQQLFCYRVGVEFPVRDTPLLDPWTIGAWLGDGDSNGTGFTTKDPEILRAFETRCPSGCQVMHYESRPLRYNIISASTKTPNPFLLGLRQLNLIKNKHIPDDYKFGSKDVRLALLAGLLDTDGHLTKPSHTCYEITQKNERLAHDIVFIARSLGFSASIVPVVKWPVINGVRGTHGTYHRVYISGEGLEDIPLVLPYKRASKRRRNKDCRNYAFEITPLGVDDYYGFETDGNHRFLLDDFTVTHNSQMTADWLYHKRHIPVGILMSSTEEATGFFKSVCGIPDEYIYGEWNPDVVDTIITQQRKLAKAGRLRNCFIVLDDLAFDKKIFNSKQMRELLFNGRHYGIMLIITAQFLGDLPTYFRSNVDYVITYRTPGIQDRERLYKNFFGVVPSFHLFQAIMDNTTENYSALVLDNTVQSNALSDCIMWYKAPLRAGKEGAFRIGCPAYHGFAKRRGKRDDPLPSGTSTQAPPPPPRTVTPGKPRVVVKKLN